MKASFKCWRTSLCFSLVVKTFVASVPTKLSNITLNASYKATSKATITAASITYNQTPVILENISENILTNAPEASAKIIMIILVGYLLPHHCFV